MFTMDYRLVKSRGSYWSLAHGSQLDAGRLINKLKLKLGTEFTNFNLLIGRRSKALLNWETLKAQLMQLKKFWHCIHSVLKSLYSTTRRTYLSRHCPQSPILRLSTGGDILIDHLPPFVPAGIERHPTVPKNIVNNQSCDSCSFFSQIMTCFLATWEV